MRITKLDGEVIRLDENQIDHIAVCPEIKVVLANGDNCFAKNPYLHSVYKKALENLIK